MIEPDTACLDALYRQSFDAFAERAFKVVEPATPYEWSWHVGCFPFEQPILTEDGPMPIGHIVETRYQGRVLSYNHQKNKTEWKKITYYFTNNGRPLYDLLCSTGDKICLTDNHPIYTEHGYVEAKKLGIGDRLLRVLQERNSQASGEQASLLQHEMFRGQQVQSSKLHLQKMRRKKRLGRQKLPRLLSCLHTANKKKRERIPLRKLWKAYLQNAIGYESIQKNQRSVLQCQMFRGSCDRQEQYGIYRWRTNARRLPQEQLQKHPQENNKTRWRQVLSMCHDPCPPFRCSSYRQRQSQQRSLEFSSTVSPVSQQAEGHAGGNIEVGECFVRSITKSLRVSETVYNIEVEDNNNYFVNGVLAHNCIAEHLEAVHSGEISKLIINIPPRTLKTYLVSVAFPAWVIGKSPNSRFINASYGSSIAEKASVKCRDVVTSEWFRRVFPDVPALRRDQNHKNDWENTLNGGYYSAGITGTITGTGCHYFLLDDPAKPDEALSDTIRASTNEAIRNTAFSRFNDPRTGRFILIMQRLHEDDPTGHLLQDGGYHLLKLPAEAKKPVLITLGKKHWAMKENDLLFPQRLTREFLDQQRTNLGDYNYAGQYLQEPVPMGGGEFRDGWEQYYREGGVNAGAMNIYILCDPAGGEEGQKKKKKLSDRTTMMVIGLAADKNYYWLDGVCDRLNPTERIDRLFELHRKWAEITGRGAKVGYEEYALMSDIHYIEKKQEDTTYRFPIVKLGGSKISKNDRIRRMIPDMQHGRWWFPLSMPKVDYMGRTIDLVRELTRSEMPTFPKARYDDMLDAMSRIYDDEMNVIFPAMPPTGAKKDYRSARTRDTAQSWVEF